MNITTTNTIILSDDSSSDETEKSNTSKNANASVFQTQQMHRPRNIAVKKGTPAPQIQQPSSTSFNTTVPKRRSLEVLKVSSKFLTNFNPLTSRREKNKRRQIITQKIVAKKPYASIYDETGKLRNTGEDLCDCFENVCTGCHFPCFNCGSQKCAIRCRNNRRFFYESIQYDGKDITKNNPLIGMMFN